MTVGSCCVAAVLLLAAARDAGCANVLAVFPFNGHSHFAMVAPLMEALADRGHRVTVISPFPRRSPPPNYVDIDVSDVLPPVISQLNVTDMTSVTANPVTRLRSLCHMNYMVCDAAFAHPQVLRLIRGPSTGFDVVFTEIFSSDCFAAFAHKFGVPLISMRTAEGSPHVHQRAANPQNPAYLVNHLLTYWPPLTFVQRLVNAASTHLGAIGFHAFSDGPSTELARRYFGVDTPPMSEIVARTSLVLVNSHHSILQARPTVPNVVEVGGIHIRDTKPNATNEWTEFCDRCGQGVIYVSFGSLIKGESFPRGFVSSLVRAFEKLPYCVLWKYEGDGIDSERIRVSKWMPQQDILSHNNIKVFITHGGLMGVMEAVHFGVPMIGIPVFGDQPANVAKCVQRGVAIGLNYRLINENVLIDSIRAIVTDDKYRINSIELSARFRDRPMSALETAVFWTEYVIKHSETTSTISSAVEMSFYEHYLLDVITFFIFISLILLYIVHKLKLILQSFFL
ncbi:UDP-glucosyltransferase 2-like isoform X3 [Adelges cooleyi]|nr:UDP-glucosyltransferase 2-like isoform X3 [Adelges cooleyi]XP_050440553.1 UDP-glucosyltransferase 2-like isoform X3 [Adelges cooleyi]XP_050440554.1 UDP-glucosyltransferase 2-like isoform X3 [Adelges cooleyi]